MKKSMVFMTAIILLIMQQWGFAANNDTVIAEVLGNPITEQQLAPSDSDMQYIKKNYSGEQLQQKIEEAKVAKLRALINMPLIEKFIKDNNIRAKDTDIKNFKSSLLEAQSNAPKNVPKLKKNDTRLDEIAKIMVLQWEVDRKLYAKYGGVVIWQQADPQEPIGAFKAFFEEQNQKGAFKINDEAYKAAYWKPYITEQSFVVPSDKVDYSQPWWEQKK